MAFNWFAGQPFYVNGQPYVFHVKDYPQLYKAYNKELVEIVKSVQITPS